MKDLVTMSTKELTRLEVLQRLKGKTLTQKEAGILLGISTRQVKRLWRAYRKQGMRGITSKRRGRPSNNHLDAGVVQQALDLILERYRDFGPTLAHEKLTEVHKLGLSRESVRRIMISEGIWKPRRAKIRAVHPMRERRACLGELVQIDGSNHTWFEERGSRCTLLVFIDDATGQLMQLWFVNEETFFGYSEATRQYLERWGKPVAFYSDKHGIFRVNQPRPLGLSSGLTQFGRAMQELDIQIICANTSQAKGRVERANQTLQDRLTKELRLLGISDMESANQVLPEFVQDYNRRFAVQARSSHNAHRPLLSGDNLALILSHQEPRSLSRNLTLQFQNVIYQIQTDRPGYALRNAQVTVCQNPKGEVTILHKNIPLAYSIFQKPILQAEVADSKTLDQMVRPALPPARNHPWRRYGLSVDGKPIPEPVSGIPE